MQLRIGHAAPIGDTRGGVQRRRGDEVLGRHLTDAVGTRREALPDERLLFEHAHSSPVSGHGDHCLQLVAELPRAKGPEHADRLRRWRDREVEGTHGGSVRACLSDLLPSARVHA